MLDWKIIATGLITLAIVIAALSMQFDVQGFLDSLKGRLPAGDKDVNRSVSVDIVVDYGNFSAKPRESDIVIYGNNFSVETDSATYRIPAVAKITNFTGNLDVVDKNVALDGAFRTIKIGDVEVSAKGGKITKTPIPFANLSIENLRVTNLSYPSASGSFVSNGIKVEITSKALDVIEPLGRFDFGDKLHITGFANKISVEGKISLSS